MNLQGRVTGRQRDGWWEIGLVVATVLAIVAFVVLAVLGAVHDARHCTAWEPYEYTVCNHFGQNKYGAGGTTICQPVRSSRCVQWDDVPSSGAP